MARILGISKAAVEAAEAAESLQLKVPDSAVSKDVKSGDTEYRWPEMVTIKDAYVKDNPKNPEHTVFFLQLQVGPGSVNKGKLVFANHYMNYDQLQAGEPSFMNDRTVSALKSLLIAGGIPVTAGSDLPAETLMAIFPEKGAGKSIFLGKRIYANIVDKVMGKQEGEIDFAKRSQNVEGYSLVS
jgi:hypothetical protein